MKKNIAVTVGLSLVLAGAPVMPAALAVAEDAPAATDEVTAGPTTPEVGSAAETPAGEGATETTGEAETPVDEGTTETAPGTNSETKPQADPNTTPGGTGGTEGGSKTEQPGENAAETTPEEKPADQTTDLSKAKGTVLITYIDKNLTVTQKTFAYENGNAANAIDFLSSVPVDFGNVKLAHFRGVNMQTGKTFAFANSGDKGNYQMMEELAAQGGDITLTAVYTNKDGYITLDDLVKMLSSKTQTKQVTKKEVKKATKEATPSTGDPSSIAAIAAALFGTGAVGVAARLRRRH